MHLFKKISFPKSLLLIFCAVLVMVPFVFIANHQGAEKKNEPKKSPDKKIVVTKITPSVAPTAAKSSVYVLTATPTNSPYPTPTQIPTSNAAHLSAEGLTITSVEPNFLWADYTNIGPHYLHIIGSGFTSQTRVDLVVTSLGEPLPSDMGKAYPVGNVSLPSSHEWWGSLPSGLYNSYYKVQAYNPDGSFVETGAVIVVSGNTQAAGTAPYPEEPTATPTLEATPTPEE